MGSVGSFGFSGVAFDFSGVDRRTYQQCFISGVFSSGVFSSGVFGIGIGMGAGLSSVVVGVVVPCS